MRSAVRLFCFLIRMVFQQIPPLLLLEFLLLVLLLVCVTHYSGNERRHVTRYSGNGPKPCYPLQRGKPHRITQHCGNK